MGFLDQLGEKAKLASEKIGEKTGDLVEFTKIKTEMMSLNTTIKKSYEKLGMDVYEMGKKGTPLNETIIKEAIDAIDERKDELAQLQMLMDANKTQK